MTMSPELAAALAARDSGRLAEAARLLRPLAEGGHVEAQAHLACLMMHGHHRFATVDEMNGWYGEATEADLATFSRDLKADVEQAMQWLQNASDHGIGPASHNLATAYLSGAGELPPETRRAKVKELLAKAREQGFAFFGGPEADEAYLGTLEGYAAGQGIGMPWDKQA